MELRNAVSAKFGIELPATVTFDYPTIAAMAGFLASRMMLHVPASSMQASVALPLADAAGGNVTEIVGLSSVMATPGIPDCGMPSL